NPTNRSFPEDPSAELIALRSIATLEALLTFHAVAMLRSYSRAAQVLQLSQPAVSARIRALERHYGAPLFAVRHRRVYLTAEGQTLLEYTQRIFNLLRRAEREVAATRALGHGRLSLAASPTIGGYLLPPLLREFSRRYPTIQAAVYVGTSAEVLARVVAEQEPVGLVEAPVSHPAVEVTPFAEDELVLVAPPDHPWARRGSVSLEELRDARLLRREAGSGTQALVDAALARAGITVQTAMELGSTETLKQAVMAGLGVTWLSRAVVARELAAGDLAAVRTPALDLRRLLFWIAPRGQPRSPADEAFLDLLREWGRQATDQVGGTDAPAGTTDQVGGTDAPAGTVSRPHPAVSDTPEGVDCGP